MATASTPLASEAQLRQDPAMLTGAQIRAARALVRWSTKDLADQAQIGMATVHRAEAVDDMPGMNARTLMKIKASFERAGVEFLDGAYSGNGGPGVRMRR